MELESKINRLKRRDCIIFVTNGIRREGIVTMDVSEEDKYIRVLLRGSETNQLDVGSHESSRIFKKAITNLDVINISTMDRLFYKGNWVDIVGGVGYYQLYSIDAHGEQIKYSYFSGDFSLIEQYTILDQGIKDATIKMMANSFYGSFGEVSGDNNLRFLPDKSFDRPSPNRYYNTPGFSVSDELVMLVSICTHLCPMGVYVDE